MKTFFSIALLATPLLFAAPASAIAPIYIEPTNPPTSNATWPTGGNYTNNFGIAFLTGSSGSFDIGGISLGLSTSSATSGSASLNLAIRNTTNSDPYLAVAGTTEYALDTISFSMPGTTSTNFTLNLTDSDLPNITAFTLQPNTVYSLIAYAPSASIGLQRTTGFANGTTNDFYTVSNGFTMLDTFRNNAPNYSNNSNSYPTLEFSLIGVPEPTPVPGPFPVLGALAALRASRVLRKRINASR